MCGIFGFVGQDSFNLEQSIASINHRGPDSDGYFTYNDLQKNASDRPTASLQNGLKVAMGFKRLAIIDLSNHANQPFADDSLHIVFNGEIYNYLEIRKELTDLGHQFHTGSDTEVLLKAYKQWGKDCVNRFNGMWAFFILDTAKRKIFVSRDRFGVKPLHYYSTNNGLYFFSEIKQIFAFDFFKKEIEESVIRDFLENAVLDASEDTFFKGVKRFPQASYAEIDIDNFHDLKPVKFWDLTRNESSYNLNYGDAKSEFREIFKSSIDLRFRSDVPVGACLSGGLDSSSIVSYSAYMGKQINAFTIDNKQPELSEIKWVNDVANKYKNVRSVVAYNSDDDLDLLDKVLDIQDEPISGLGVIAQWKVMELAAKNKVVVLLDGQGGDEIFGGYRKYVFFYLKELIKSGQIFKALKEASKFLSATEFKIFEKEGVRRYLNRTNVADYLTEQTLKHPKLHNIGIQGASGFQQKSYEDVFYYSYPQLLRYEDRNSMAFSLESRVPFLDYRLVEFVYSLPSSYKMRNGYSKALLRDSMEGILPDSIRLRRSKLGFATPEKKWLTGTYKQMFSDYFKKMDNPYLNNKLISEHYDEGKDALDYKSLLRIYLFDYWYKKHFN